MLTSRLYPLLLISSMLLLATGCSQEAEDKVAEAGQDLQAAWQAEKEAAVEQMKATMESVSEDVDAVRNRARQLENEGEAAAAMAWNDVAEKLESAQDAAANDLQALEDAGADTWQSARDRAQASMERLDETWDEGRAAIAASFRESVDAAIPQY